MSAHLVRSFLRISIGIRQGILSLLLLLFSGQAVADGSFSGSWFNPDRNGEGFHIEILDGDQALLIWFTYPGPTDTAAAEQAWILGTGNITGNTISIVDAYRTSGPVFGDNYNKDDLVITTWGDLTVTFSDDAAALVEYSGLDGSGSTQVTRLSTLADSEIESSLPPGIAGGWFDQDTNGQGWFVEILSATTALVYWFTYDQNGNQAWNLGLGNIFDRQIVLPDNLAGTGTGFGAAFKAEDVELSSFGMFVMEFTDCSSGSIGYLTAGGIHSGSYPIGRLTGLDGYACDSIGDPTLDQSVMTNSTDPLLSQYFGLDLTEVGLFGKKSADGRFDRLRSGFLQTPSGDSLNFELDTDGQLFSILDNSSDITLTAEVDTNGDATIILNDPANDASATISNEAPDAKKNARSTVSGLQSRADFPETSHTSESGSAVLEVELCGQAASDARVNFRIEDPSGPIILPATQSEPGRYQTDLPTSLGPPVDDSIVNENCAKTADEFGQVCNLVSGNGDLTSDECLQLGRQIAVVDADASTRAAAVCASATAAFASACAANELRMGSCGPSADKVYRDFSSVQVSAESKIPGLVGTSVSQALSYDTPGVELIFPKLVLQGEPYYQGHTIMPSTPTAGESYTVNVSVGCIDEGQTLLVTNTTNGSSSTCTVDDSGHCLAQVVSESTESFNALEISGPDNFSASTSVTLAAPAAGNTDLTGSWFVEEVEDARDCGEGVNSFSYTASVIQTNNEVRICEMGTCLNGFIEGNIVRWNGSYPEDGGVTTVSVMMTVASDGNSMSGMSTWNWTDGSFSCTGSAEISATRL